MKNLISKMAHIVAPNKMLCQWDFYVYDMKYIESENCRFPMIWIVGEQHCHLLKIGQYRDSFFNKQVFRSAYAQGNDTFSNYFDPQSFDPEDKVYLIEEKGLSLISREAALNAIKDYVIPAVKEWKEKYGALTKSKVKVHLHNISISALKEKIAASPSLLSVLKRFHNYLQVSDNHQVDVYYRASGNYFFFAEVIDGRDNLVGSINYCESSNRWAPNT